MQAGAGGALRADHERKAVADGVPYLCVLDGSAELQPSNENGPARGFDWSLSIDDLARRSGNVGIRVHISLAPLQSIAGP